MRISINKGKKSLPERDTCPFGKARGESEVKDKSKKADSDICLFRKERDKESDVKQKKTKDIK